ncbi:LytTR family transcriptional regulator DNA-binding domain-containing protein [Lactobacillus bombicola]|uniref:DNA-binding response regulator n=1 Tax=Lactobacillus bombicola TaxID=1505723 RepID=A0ABX9LX27_9LACO|nr:LytTR family transcriptional regulator DNA-binding domain-containing protein [Lactobacillus bombicola]RHW50794.1 DNA-binding response regulator [Lactobacillus bombicola]RHW51643.1 DNA-binding response regulator [Lactobacillus bombicola]
MKILVVDDEPLARTELLYLIKKSPSLKNHPVTLYQAEDIKEAQGILLKHLIDLLFLDISLNDENGFELAEELKQLAHAPLIIFATAYDEYAVKAFDIGAFDYILKPFEQKRIDRALKKATANLTAKFQKTSSNGSEVLIVELDDRNVVIKKANIVAATVNNGVLTITTSKQKFETRKTLAWLKQHLTDVTFVQVHRNAIVNIGDIKEIQPWFNHTLLLLMSNGVKIQVGRSYRKELKRRLDM